MAGRPRVACGAAVVVVIPTTNRWSVQAATTSQRITVVRASTGGQGQLCPADTSAGVALVRTTGEGVCLLGHTSRYDDTRLASMGTNPITGEQVMNPKYVPGVLAVMAMAGLYDDSGKWFFHTGLPAKSGGGGGLIAGSPGRFGIVVVPSLDVAGNSVRRQKAITGISNAFGGNSLGAPPIGAKTPSE